ncbi:MULTISPECIES: NUDIX hydrolase [unclassified Sphingomonas]|jgi:8-oxo-dGTP pyrophosphatase MutT (NUDIX family)|uniref:NUDIX hydrolase n=1 Tax=unclassified Sphingomonas TaxID=196159 RepID=UPI000832FC0B|nr:MULTISPECIES: NUDIX domain-containing protein [unclassified Sphingomonas]
MTSPVAQPPIPAATLILFRDRAGAPPELLFVERSPAMRFAGGAIVFPGGRIDAADYALARLQTDDDAAMVERAARIAAIRETAEEAGVAVGLTGEGDLSRLRRDLAGGMATGAALHDAGYALATDRLTPFARWCPDFPHARVFDTRFYLARAPDDMAMPEVDGTENVRVFWASAADILDQADRDEVRLIFPTRRTLERLAGYACFADALADAAEWPIRKITPWVERRDGVDMLCIPDDLGYPITASPADAAFRA